MNRKYNTRTLVQIALLAAIEVVLAFTPLGYIPLPFVRATTIHIPVIIGAIIIGPMAGGILGGVFGITSIVNNTINPTITSFVFSPFYSAGDFGGNLWSVFIAMVPRILIGVFAGWAFRALIRVDKTKLISYVATGIIGSLTNTILVMSSIYIFFGEPYAAARGVSHDALMGVIMGIVGVNGVPEAIVAGVLTVFIAKPLSLIATRQAARQNA